MKNLLTRRILHFVLVMIGILLMIGGIVTGKHGVSVVGLIVAAVNVQQWIKWNKEENNNKST